MGASHKALLIWAMAPAMLAIACGGRRDNQRPLEPPYPHDATGESSAGSEDAFAIPDASDEDAGESLPDASDADGSETSDSGDGSASGYIQKAPHCTHDPDASAPVPFDAGADGSPGVLALPQIVASGGAVLRQATFVSVTFPGDAYADELDDFVAAVGCTPYWRAIGSDYGVGDAVAAPAVRINDSPPAAMDDTNLRTWLAAKIESGDPLFPRPAPGTVYVLWYPEATQITVRGGKSCSDFDAYHQAWQLTDGTPFSYAVQARCAVDGGAGQLQNLTVSASHELIEACTDPRQDTQPAYAPTDPNHPGSAFAYGTEVGDLCLGSRIASGGSWTFQPSGFPWYVQKIWSNKNAWLGSDPCVPADTTNYYYAAPLVSDTMTTSVVTGSPLTVSVVHVPVGGSATIGVRLVSNYASGTMFVSPLDLPQLKGQPRKLIMFLDKPAGQPGDTIHLTIQKVSGDPVNGAEPFVLFAHGPAGTPTTAFWALTSD